MLSKNWRQWIIPKPIDVTHAKSNFHNLEIIKNKWTPKHYFIIYNLWKSLRAAPVVGTVQETLKSQSWKSKQDWISYHKRTIWNPKINEIENLERRFQKELKAALPNLLWNKDTVRDTINFIVFEQSWCGYCLETCFAHYLSKKGMTPYNTTSEVDSFHCIDMVAVDKNETPTFYQVKQESQQAKKRADEAKQKAKALHPEINLKFCYISTDKPIHPTRIHFRFE